MGKGSSKLSAESLERLKQSQQQHHHQTDLSGDNGLTKTTTSSTTDTPNVYPFNEKELAEWCKGTNKDFPDAQLTTVLENEQLLVPFLTDIFYQEVEVSDCIQTLFRGNSLASKIMSHCFRTFGSKYLKQLLEPHIRTSSLDSVSYEIDSSRLEDDDDMSSNQKNLIKLTKQVLDSIHSSSVDFPPQLTSMCVCLNQVLCKKYSNSSTNLRAVGTVIFLRFINPAIVSPYEAGIVDKQPSPKSMRGLMLVSKILQNIANNVEFSKEEHMLPFNDFVRAHFEPMRQWVLKICNIDDPLIEEGATK